MPSLVSVSMPKHKKSAAKNKSAPLSKYYKIAILAILAYALVYSIVFLEGPSFFGDDTVYLNLAHSITQGNFHESSFIFSVRLLQAFPIAVFYKLFGVSMLSSSAWDILSYILTIAVVFLLGRELYDNYAGIVSALLFAVFPMIVQLSATISDDIPMAFVTSLAMLALLYATKYGSKKWYFVTGVLIIASVLVTPEGGIIAFPIFAYLIIQMARKKIKPNSVSAYFIYGLLAAGIILMAFNYASSGDPLITFTLTSHFYSAVGGQNTIPSTNTDPMFYIQNMFPYNILQTVYTGINNGDLNSISLFNSVYVINYNAVGFYFYIMAICAIFLLLRRERRSYFAILWLIVAFLYLEFGPMHLSISPFSYLLSYRLERFLTIIAAPTVLIIGIAVSRLAGIRRRRAGKILGLAMIIFLILTALPINGMWYQVTYAERFDQIAIANYLNQLPNTTTVYMASSFSNLPIYMGFNNMSRFIVYDSISNCTLLHGNSYVIIPKYIRMFGLNYTPDPSSYCPSWKLVLYPNISQPLPRYITSIALPFNAKLYFVPENAANGISLGNGSNYSNLTGVGTLHDGAIGNFITINRVESINLSLSQNSVPANGTLNITVTYSGEFGWSDGSQATRYLESPMINIHYFGVEFANQSNLSVQNSPDFNDYASYYEGVGNPVQSWGKNASTTLAITWPFTVSSTAAGKTLKICGGYYASYNSKTWPSLYYRLSSASANVQNSTVISIVSRNCSYLHIS